MLFFMLKDFSATPQRHLLSGFLNNGGISDDLIKVEGDDEEEEMISPLDKKFLWHMNQMPTCSGVGYL